MLDNGQAILIWNKISEQEAKDYTEFATLNTLREFQVKLQKFLNLQEKGNDGSYYRDTLTIDGEKKLNLRVSNHYAHDYNYKKPGFIRLSFYLEHNVMYVENISPPISRKNTIFNEVAYALGDFNTEENKMRLIKNVLGIIKKAVKDGEVDLLNDAPSGHINAVQTLPDPERMQDDNRYRPKYILGKKPIKYSDMNVLNKIYDSRRPSVRKAVRDARMRRVRDNDNDFLPINPDSSGDDAYTVSFAAGNYSDDYDVWADSEEEAVEVVVAYLLREKGGAHCYSQEEAEDLFSSEIEEYLAQNPDADRWEAVDYATERGDFMYWDATMEGAPYPVYLDMARTGISERKGVMKPAREDDDDIYDSARRPSLRRPISRLRDSRATRRASVRDSRMGFSRSRYRRGSR